jgi:hypothetical protein
MRRSVQARSEFMIDKLKALEPKDRSGALRDWAKKGLITNATLDHMITYLRQGATPAWTPPTSP